MQKVYGKEFRTNNPFVIVNGSDRYS